MSRRGKAELEKEKEGISLGLKYAKISKLAARNRPGTIL